MALGIATDDIFVRNRPLRVYNAAETTKRLEGQYESYYALLKATDGMNLRIKGEKPNHWIGVPKERDEYEHVANVAYTDEKTRTTD